MSVGNLEDLQPVPKLPVEVESEFDDVSIKCIDCSLDFIWTIGEQTFFRDKQLQNPPKRCKECKKAKNRRLEAIELSKTTGKRHRIEVKAQCANCGMSTTVPFYPCQGRPVYCRACFANTNGLVATARDDRS
ncbi:MAG: zinc-ribbon domain containing protein [Pyrinomonadaceae bacterium]